jgi:hypothetical protein
VKKTGRLLVRCSLGVIAVVGARSLPARADSVTSHFLPNAPAPGAAVPSSGDGGRARQALATLGREDRFANQSPLPPGAHPPRCRPVLRKGRPVDPVAEIVRRARGARIVIINEAHDAPLHRAFVGDVAAALRPLGFSIYAAETFRPEVGRKAPAHPRETDGYYTLEPMFGELIRRLRRLGYAFVPYEYEIAMATPPPQGDQAPFINKREEGQAVNLVQRIFKADPRARVLIHAGYGHASEAVSPAGKGVDGKPFGSIRFMAARLRDKTGIDPLTIDQTRMEPGGDASVICSNQGMMPGYDVHVRSPAPRFRRGRPTWRIARGERLVEVPAALRRSKQRIVVEARRADEPADAVPRDRVLIDPGETIPLLLPPGAYRVRAWTRKDARWGQPVDLVVK